MGKFARKLAEAIARKKANRLTAKAPKSVGGVSKVKTVIKAAMKPKIMEQTPVGMANATKSTPYIPPVKKNTKVKL